MTRFILILFAALVCYAPSAQEVPLDTLVSVEEGIRRSVLTRDLPRSHAVPMILRAGASRNPAHIPLLKEVIDSWAAGGSNDHYGYRSSGVHTGAALYSLWLIGGSEEYFRENLYNWEKDYMLAHYSAQVLLLDATPELVEELRALCEVSNNPNGSNDLWGALSSAQDVLDANQAYESLPSDAARASYVINYLGGTWAPWWGERRMNPSGSGWTEISYKFHRPVLVWRWFRTLLREQPALIDMAIENVSCCIRDWEQGVDRAPTPEEKPPLQEWLRHMAAIPTR